MAHWDYQLDGGVYSKVDEADISRSVKRGALTGSTLIRRSDEIDWYPLSKHPSWEGPLQVEEAASVRILEIRRLNLLIAFTIWFFLTLFGVYLSFKTAESYNPEGNGMFNAAEAAIMNSAWLKLVASLLGAVLSSIAFGIWIIAARIAQVGEVNRSAALAVIEELRRRR